MGRGELKKGILDPKNLTVWETICTVSTQWQGNTLAQTALTVQFPQNESANKQMVFPEETAAKPCLRECMAVL